MKEEEEEDLDEETISHILSERETILSQDELENFFLQLT